MTAPPVRATVAGARPVDGRPRARPSDGPIAKRAGLRWWDGRVFWGVVGVAATLVVVEVVARVGAVPRRYMPTVAEIATALVGRLGRADLWAALGATATGWLVGMLLAVAGGIVSGLALGLHPVVRAATASTVDFLRPVPSVAFIPVVVLLYGTGLASKLVLVVYAALWPVLLQVVYGIREVDPVARDTARALRLGPLARLRHLVWPATLPFAATGIRLSASVALVLCVASEMIIGNPGLGSEIAAAKDGGAIPDMYALILLAGLLGIAVNVAVRLALHALLRHHPPDAAGRPA